VVFSFLVFGFGVVRGGVVSGLHIRIRFCVCLAVSATCPYLTPQTHTKTHNRESPELQRRGGAQARAPTSVRPAATSHRWSADLLRVHTSHPSPSSTPTTRNYQLHIINTTIIPPNTPGQFLEPAAEQVRLHLLRARERGGPGDHRRRQHRGSVPAHGLLRGQ
jgi:hypothetical protein